MATLYRRGATLRISPKIPEAAPTMARSERGDRHTPPGVFPLRRLGSQDRSRRMNVARRRMRKRAANGLALVPFPAREVEIGPYA